MASDIDRQALITRREAILRVSAVLSGAALVGQSAMLAGCGRRETEAELRAADGAFTAAEIAFLDEIAETILPETSTPGAKAAGVGAFMALMVTDVYTAREQRVFRDGMQTVDQESRDMHGDDFMAATPSERLALLEKLDAEQLRYMQDNAADEPAHYFRMMKELALLGYFTSEIGCTRAMRYVETPGRFDPCVPYSPGETIWAQHGSQTRSS